MLVMYPMNYVHVVVGFITPLRTGVNPCDCWRRPAMRTYSSSTFSDTVDSLRYLACLGRMALEVVEEKGSRMFLKSSCSYDFSFGVMKMLPIVLAFQGFSYPFNFHHLFF